MLKIFLSLYILTLFMDWVISTPLIKVKYITNLNIFLKVGNASQWDDRTIIFKLLYMCMNDAIRKKQGLGSVLIV